MALKVKKIPDFITELGYKDENTVFSIADVQFRNNSSEIAINWEITPSNYKEGTQKQFRTQIIPFDWTNPDFVSLLLQNSDIIHDLSMSTPFIPTPDGVKSFTDFKAETIDVGLP